jgi:hypothetical protein
LGSTDALPSKIADCGTRAGYRGALTFRSAAAACPRAIPSGNPGEPVIPAIGQTRKHGIVLATAWHCPFGNPHNRLARRHHGVYCCVFVVVTVVDGGGAATCTDVVLVRSVVVVCVDGPDPQALSSTLPPSNADVNNSRVPAFISIMMDLLGQGRIRQGAPIRHGSYWVLVVVVCCVVVTAAGGGYVVVLVTLSDATPLLLP